VYYPNPVKDVLNFLFIQKIDRLTVYNLLGQEILTKNFNQTDGQLDMSTLTKGSYLIKIMYENLTKTIKIIKQ
jgi:hypothetical protein